MSIREQVSRDPIARCEDRKTAGPAVLLCSASRGVFCDAAWTAMGEKLDLSPRQREVRAASSMAKAISRSLRPSGFPGAPFKRTCNGSMRS